MMHCLIGLNRHMQGHKKDYSVITVIPNTNNIFTKKLKIVPIHPIFNFVFCSSRTRCCYDTSRLSVFSYKY